MEDADSAGQEAIDGVNNDQLSRLRYEMDRAIQREDDERAADLRDEIQRREEANQ